MSKAQETREKLLTEGRRLFWSRGYSNVSLREIAGAAQVDVALVSRYFGSKLGLFEATLDLVDGLDPAHFPDSSSLVDAVVAAFSGAPRGGEAPSPVTLILMNAADPEVGDLVRAKHHVKWQAAFETILQSSSRAALLSAVLLGISVAEKTLHLDGIAAPNSPEYEAQLRTLIGAALSV